MPLLLVGLLAITPVAYAQVPTRPDPVVTVKLAPSLEAKAKKLGDREVAEMAQELTKEVRQALAGSHSPGAPVRADLVLVGTCSPTARPSPNSAIIRAYLCAA